MGFFDTPGDKDKHQGECRKGDGWKTQKHDRAEDALKEADRHSEEAHGSKYLGFRWK